MSVIKIHGATFFNYLMADDSVGQVIEALRDSYGVRWLRVFGMWSQGFNPFSSGSPNDYYAVIRTMADDLVNRFGMGLHFTYGTDQVAGSPIVVEPSKFLDYAEAAVEALVPYRDSVIWEDWNEFYKNSDAKTMIPASITAPLMATTSSLDNTTLDYAGPTKDYSTHHARRDWRGAADFKSLYDICKLNGNHTSKPAVGNEPGKIVLDFTAQQAHEYALGADLMGAGSFLHDLDLEFCRMPTDPAKLDAMAAVVEAWALPVDGTLVQDGTYSSGSATQFLPIAHQDGYDNATGAPVNETGTIRTYALTRDTFGQAIPVGPRPRYTPQAINGWRITDRAGRYGSLITVQR